MRQAKSATEQYATKLQLLLAGASLTIACGSSPPKPPETTPPQGDTASAPATASSEAPKAEASGAAASAPAPAASAAPASGNPSLSTPTENAPALGIIAQGHDECAGTSAPFEEKVRAKFNECYQAGKKKNPELQGTIKVTLKIDLKGKVKYVPEPSKLDKPVLDCMVKAVKKEPFDAKACKGKDVAVSKTFGSG